jgi:3-deoxy-D-manno-octulosonic acid kinase
MTTSAALQPVDVPRGAAFVRSDCAAWLSGPLASGFEAVTDRRPVKGRSRHFICRPDGAPYSILVRTPTRGGLWSFLGDRHLSRARIRREIEGLRRAREAGVEVADLIGYRAEPRLLFQRLTCVYPAIESAETLEAALRRLRGSARWELLQRVASTARALHRADVRHGDLNARNILVGPGDRITLIDFDAAGRGGGFPEIVRLCRSLHKTLGSDLMATDKARLIRDYIDPKMMLKPMLARCEAAIARHRLWWRLSLGPARE